ncbi:MAG: hypothetical protein AB7S61_07990 [Methanoregulaceae archaeon]
MEDLLRTHILCAVLSLCLLLVPVSAYDDVGGLKAHTAINTNAVTLFQSQLMPADPYLKAPLATLDGMPCWGYAWEPKEDGGPGEMVLAPATRPDIRKQKKMKDWIIGGGYSADEPEGPSALVHFYDPMAGEGQRHLTDQQFVITVLHYLSSTLNANPETDARDWGLKDLSRNMEIYGINFIQEYAYDDAKENLLKALASHENNNEFYGRAWRGIGETMHMISDMTVPAHVRNDGHAAALRDSDPYESTTNFEHVNQYAGNSPASLQYRQNINGLMHDVARFTNNNFYSKDTIPGQTTSTTKYSLPDLTKMDVIKGGSLDGYLKDSAGRVTAAPNSWAKKAWSGKAYAIDPIVVDAQRRVLVPTAVRSSAAVLDRFLPRFEVTMRYAPEDPNDPDSGRYTMHGEIRVAKDAWNRLEWPERLEINNGATIVLTKKDGTSRQVKVDPKIVRNMNEFSFDFSAKPDETVDLMYDLGGYCVYAKKDEGTGLKPGVWKFTGKQGWPNEIAIVRNAQGVLVAEYRNENNIPMTYTFEETTIPLDSKNVDAAFRELFEEGVRQGFFTSGQKTLNTFTARMKNPNPTDCSAWDVVINGGVSHDGRKFVGSYTVSYVCGSDRSQYYDRALVGTWLREYTGGAVDGSFARTTRTTQSAGMPVGVNPYGIQ